MRAIDLYSGVGGWTLGLMMAGIETVASFEWWTEANSTYETNFGRSPYAADIRELPLDALPKEVDVVVGSPPCTQFSFANRGGNGDIDDGLKDIAKFLEAVAYVRPRFWVMENVPRVAGILEREIGLGGKLSRFGELVKVITVVDMADFGLPQRRKRMLAGDFPLQLLHAYRGKESAPTLGAVVDGLASDPVVDPIYGIALKRELLKDHLEEVALCAEEGRLNREMKQEHPFYNVMSFPDPLDRTSRTVTALCTRVSRESIVVRVGGRLRRLTLRERATLQGFPITFQFCGRSYTDKLKLVGNAIPPILTYYIAHSFLGTPPAHVKSPKGSGYQHPLPDVLPAEIKPPVPRRRFAPDRRFRAVIPHLRFGSGVRFEMANNISAGAGSWGVGFYFGSSKDVRAVELNDRILGWTMSLLASKRFELTACSGIEGMSQTVQGLSPERLQLIWIQQAQGLHPFELVDRLGELAKHLHDALPRASLEDIETSVLREIGQANQGTLGRVQREKLRRNASWIFAGFIVGAWFNSKSGLRAAGHLAEAM